MCKLVVHKMDKADMAKVVMNLFKLQLMLVYQITFCQSFDQGIE